MESNWKDGEEAAEASPRKAICCRLWGLPIGIGEKKHRSWRGTDATKNVTFLRTGSRNPSDDQLETRK